MLSAARDLIRCYEASEKLGDSDHIVIRFTGNLLFDFKDINMISNYRSANLDRLRRDVGNVNWTKVLELHTDGKILCNFRRKLLLKRDDMRPPTH